ncbi:unnamed protein product [Paramecium sonneborni]|uniref:Transmembrane protein n=1 Tax=Paramecium sonneborni TaxID=65129 RepID=A0A8S1R6R4_9CILI|nr:unnamed protein product [Paramecium sonneborni]
MYIYPRNYLWQQNLEILKSTNISQINNLIKIKDMKILLTVWMKNKSNKSNSIQSSTRQDNFIFLVCYSQDCFYLILVQSCQNLTDFNNCTLSDDIVQQIIDQANNIFKLFKLTILKIQTFTTLTHFIKLIMNQIILLMKKNKVQMLHPFITKFKSILKLLLIILLKLIRIQSILFFPFFFQTLQLGYQNTKIDTALNFKDNSSLTQPEVNLDAKKRIHFITYPTAIENFLQSLDLILIFYYFLFIIDFIQQMV